MEYRKPQPSDIGKPCEISADGANWEPSVLGYMVVGADGPLYYNQWHNPGGKGRRYCRIECKTTADALLISSDYLSEVVGHEAAAQFLRLFGSLTDVRLHWMLGYCKLICDGEFPPGDSFSDYQAFTNMLISRMATNLNIPEHLIAQDHRPNYSSAAALSRAFRPPMDTFDPKPMVSKRWQQP